MATAAQILANQTNAKLSTGPKTAEGKARSAKNAIKNGFHTVPALKPEDKEHFLQFEADLRESVIPVGALEEGAFLQFRDAAWRLEKIYALLNDLHVGDIDPLINPEVAAQLTQLNRYRAAAEMQLYRSIKLLRELHNAWLLRRDHLTEEESAELPTLLTPKTILSRPFIVPKLTDSNPIPLNFNCVNYSGSGQLQRGPGVNSSQGSCP